MIWICFASTLNLGVNLSSSLFRPPRAATAEVESAPGTGAFGALLEYRRLVNFPYRDMTRGSHFAVLFEHTTKPRASIFATANVAVLSEITLYTRGVVK